VAGIYPALYLSSFNVIRILKGWRASSSAILPRKILVVVQFTISTILIIGTVIVYQQIQFTKDRPVGYTRDGLLTVQMTSPDFNNKFELLRTELKSTRAVVEIAESSGPPTEIWSTNGGFDWEGRNPSSEPVFANLAVTPEYGKTIGWQFVNGRDFSRELASDSAAFVINEAAAVEFGFEDPIGKAVRWTTPKSNFADFKIIGVISDMVMGSPYARNMPAIYFVSKEGYHHFINIKIDPTTNTSDALPKIEGVFRKVIPNVPFDYKFADQEYAQKFITEERIGKLSSIFAVFAILISCLGLFGLSSFVAEQRTKEIGIRKILGASIAGLWQLLSSEFIFLVFISGALAIPFAYYYLNNWLLVFQYRIEISWWVFAITIAGTLAITLFTVSLQTIRVSLMNPVKSLRTE
jgi:putative ABC transport system permease protein